MAAPAGSQLQVEVGRIQMQCSNHPNSVQVFDNPSYDPKRDSPEMFGVAVNGAGLVVRAVELSVTGKRPSLEAAIDEAAARHTTEETILAEWMAADPESGSVAAALVIRLARLSGLAPDQSWHGQPQRGLTAPIPDYPPIVERWGHVVDYDSGHNERSDWLRACESIEKARALFEHYARD